MIKSYKECLRKIVLVDPRFSRYLVTSIIGDKKAVVIKGFLTMLEEELREYKCDIFELFILQSTGDSSIIMRVHNLDTGGYAVFKVPYSQLYTGKKEDQKSKGDQIYLEY